MFRARHVSRQSIHRPDRNPAHEHNSQQQQPRHDPRARQGETIGFLQNLQLALAFGGKRLGQQFHFGVHAGGKAAEAGFRFFADSFDSGGIALEIGVCVAANQFNGPDQFGVPIAQLLRGGQR